MKYVCSALIRGIRESKTLNAYTEQQAWFLFGKTFGFSMRDFKAIPYLPLIEEDETPVDINTDYEEYKQSPEYKDWELTKIDEKEECIKMVRNITVNNVTRKVFVKEVDHLILEGAVGTASFVWNRKEYALPLLKFNKAMPKGQALIDARRLARDFILAYIDEADNQQCIDAEYYAAYYIAR